MRVWRPLVSMKTPRPASLSETTRARSSFSSARREGIGTPPSPLWAGEVLVEKPIAPARIASSTSRRTLALEQGEVLRHRFELPADAAPQHFERHALDLRQVAHHQVPVRRTARRDGEAAVADDRGGDAERRRGRGARIPGELRVVMRVVVDDPRHQRQAAGIDCFFCAVLDFSDFRDAAVLDAHVSVPGRRTQTVEKQRAADREVVHGGWPVYWRAMELLKRVVLLALALCTLAPLVAAAHENHEASAAAAVAAAPSHCPDDGGPGCGGHGSSCMRAGELDMIDAAPMACALQRSSFPSLLFLTVAVPPRSAPLSPFPPRAPPVSS